jgi:hypothetical protein
MDGGWLHSFLCCCAISDVSTGDVDLKLGCNVSEFILRTGAFVGDISVVNVARNLQCTP